MQKLSEIGRGRDETKREVVPFLVPSVRYCTAISIEAIQKRIRNLYVLPNVYYVV